MLGCADIARRRALPALAACASTVTVAVASRSAAKAAAFGAEFGCAAVHGYRALLADDAVEAVYIAVPTGLHAEWAAEALAAGKHVLVEKPMAATAADAAALAERAERAGLVLMENRMFTRHPQHRVVRDAVARGEIGLPRVLSAGMTIPPRPADDIRYRADLGGGALLDVGYYPLHTALLLLGHDVRLDGAVVERDERLGVDLGGALLLSTARGAVAHLTFGIDHHYRAAYELCGTAGAVTAARAYTPPPSAATEVVLERPGGSRRVGIAPFDQFAAVMAEFASAVRGGTRSADHLAGELAVSVRALELLDEARDRAQHRSNAAITPL
uniref:NocS4 n=1 Tax=Nocardia sp. ATCC 202099 TaxID=930400 RepID=E5DUG8_9NOCA|nr:NocS4 [Nocardia sp. ATCC 202099]